MQIDQTRQPSAADSVSTVFSPSGQSTMLLTMGGLHDPTFPRAPMHAEGRLPRSSLRKVLLPVK